MQSNNPGKSIICNIELGGLAVEKNLVVTNYYDQSIVREDTIMGLVLQAKHSASFSLRQITKHSRRYRRIKGIKTQNKPTRFNRVIHQVIST